MVAYLEAALEDGEATVVAAALGDIARASGMGAIAHETGLGRESLYKALSAQATRRCGLSPRVVQRGDPNCACRTSVAL
jgi:probable addiction module antidote protein